MVNEVLTDCVLLSAAGVVVVLAVDGNVTIDPASLPLVLVTPQDASLCGPVHALLHVSSASVVDIDEGNNIGLDRVILICHDAGMWLPHSRWTR